MPGHAHRIHATADPLRNVSRQRCFARLLFPVAVLLLSVSLGAGLLQLLGCGRAPGRWEECFADEDCAATSDCTRFSCGEDRLCHAQSIDADDDGYLPVACGGRDCDDTDPMIHPGAIEQCSGRRDENCDGLIDCSDPDCSTAPECCAMRYEDCGDGVDNDCDGLIDCAAPDCGGAVPCGGLPCENYFPEYAAECGDILPVGRQTARTSRYSCGGPMELGRELVLPFVGPADASQLTQVVLRLDGSDQGVLSLFVLEGDLVTGASQVCDPGRCVAASTNSGPVENRVVLIAEPGRLYFIVMDSTLGQEGGGQLHIDCTAYCHAERCGDGWDNDCDGLVDCEDPECREDAECLQSDAFGHFGQGIHP
jgi:hypothetical protein